MSRLVSRIATFLILGVAALAITAPFLWIFRGAFSASDAELYRLPPTFHPGNLTTGNFGKVTDQVPYFRFFVNSIIVSTTVTVAQIITCATAGYAFARLTFRGKGVLFAIVIGSLMIPIQVTIVPLFLVMSKLSLTNTLWSLILPGIFSGFGIFLLRQHFMAMPYELEEAAKLDGAGHFRTFTRVILPLSGPSIAMAARSRSACASVTGRRRFRRAASASISSASFKVCEICDCGRKSRLSIFSPLLSMTRE